jgi:hypothetical protein
MGSRRSYDKRTAFASYLCHQVRGWVDDYPVEGKRGLPLYRIHGNQLEQKEVVLVDDEAAEVSPPDHCWGCEEQMDDLRDAVSCKLLAAILHPVRSTREHVGANLPWDGYDATLAAACAAAVG